MICLIFLLFGVLKQIMFVVQVGYKLMGGIKLILKCNRVFNDYNNNKFIQYDYFYMVLLIKINKYINY